MVRASLYEVAFIISFPEKNCNLFDILPSIGYNKRATGTDSRGVRPNGCIMRKVRAPQGKDNG